MKFKVGDRVKYGNVTGQITGIDSGAVDFYRIDFGGSWYRETDLELIQSEVSLTEAAKEPVPGKFYRTRKGYKAVYVGKTLKNKYLYDSKEEGL